MQMLNGMIVPDAGVLTVSTDKDYTVQPDTDTVVIVSTAKLSLTIKLPKAVKSVGRFVCVYLKAISSTETTVRIADAGDTDYDTIELVNITDCVCLYCDGLYWFVVSKFTVV